MAATAQLSLVESFTYEDFLSHLSYSESAMLESGISRIRARDLLKKMSKGASLPTRKTQGTPYQECVNVRNSDTLFPVAFIPFHAGLYRCFVFRKVQG